MPPITTRPARWADQHQLLEMITALADHHDDTATLDLNTLRRDIFDPDPWIHVSVAVRNNEIIGYTALCPLMQLQFGARGMDIHHMFVTPSQRNNGVGRLLIKDAINWAIAKHCRYLMVGTSPDNIPAQLAYLACGFNAVPNTPNRFHMTLP